MYNHLPNFLTFALGKLHFMFSLKANDAFIEVRNFIITHNK